MAQFKNAKGFTLVEMLVAMSIFVVFMGVLLNSYAGIVRAQHEANNFRVMYSESRRVFDALIVEFRDGMVDYGFNTDFQTANLEGAVSEIHLISEDGEKRLVKYEDGVVSVGEVALNSSDVFIKEFIVKVNPSVDPYSSQYVNETVHQFHPSVTIFAKFERERKFGDPYIVNFQTSISSRLYNQLDAE